jgi:hypothetical protein
VENRTPRKENAVQLRDHPELNELAARQYAAFTTPQALQHGLSHRVLRHWQAEGRIAQRHPRVFIIAGSPQIWEQSLTAAILAAGPAAAVSHRPAARLWGLLDDDTVEITVPRNRFCRLDGVVVHRSRDLADDHVIRWKGLPVTKPARTIVDLGAVLPPDEVEDVLDRARPSASSRWPAWSGC